MKYLLDELQNYENDYGDQLAPGAVAKDVSFMGNHAEVQMATGKDMHNLTRSMHERIDSVERKLGNQLGGLTRLVTSMAVSLAGVPAQPTEPHVSVLPAAAELLPGVGMGHLAVAWTPPPPLPQRTPSVSVRSTLDAPSPQENKDFRKEKMIWIGMFLCGDQAVSQENKTRN